MVELLEHLDDPGWYEFEDMMNQRAEEIMQRPFQHLLTKSGKEIRSKFLRTLRCWCPLDDCQIDVLNEFVKMGHNITLILDDIQDRTLLRRGLPAAHMIYGIPAAIQSVNYVIYCHVLGKLRQEAQIFAPKNYSTQHSQNLKIIPFMKAVLKGQIMEVYWRDNFVCPTVEQYMDMVSKKTTTFFRIAVAAITEYYQKDFHLNGFDEMIGQYFQIRDDYLNLKSSQFHQDKGFCEDLTEGKFSFPIVYAINAYPEDKRILDILKKRPKDVQEKLRCLEVLEELGCFEVTVKMLDKMFADMQNSIQHLGGNQELLALLETLNY